MRDENHLGLIPPHSRNSEATPRPSPFPARIDKLPTISLLMNSSPFRALPLSVSATPLALAIPAAPMPVIPCEPIAISLPRPRLALRLAALARATMRAGAGHRPHDYGRVPIGGTEHRIDWLEKPAQSATAAHIG